MTGVARLLCPDTGHIIECSTPLPYGVKRQLDEGALFLAEDTAEQPGDRPEGQPRGNASRAAWITYAIGQGMGHTDASVLSRDELRDRFRDTGFDPAERPVADIRPAGGVL